VLQTLMAKEATEAASRIKDQLVQNKSQIELIAEKIVEL